ncbi:MAG: RDD family protein [Betaproteobacteria bacterium]|nr:RDD family protein [Betaproteobacteria bacterium]
MLDTARRIGTPEGIELTLRLAGPVPRALAWLIDFAIRVAALFVLAIAVGPFGNLGQAAFLLTWFLLEWLFPAWCEAQWNGQTPGKKALGIAVLNDDGTPVRWPAALARNLLRAVDFLPIFYGFGLATMLINRDFKRLGDLAANTLVVYRDAAPRGSAVPPAEPLAPPLALSVVEQRAVLEFAERAPGLTSERAEELAELAQPLVGAGTGAARRLVRMANFLVGRR